MSKALIKNVVILGSTGSIGQQAVEVVLAHPDRFSVFGLSACQNVDALMDQAHTLHPRFVACPAVRDAGRLPAGTRLLSDADAAATLAGMPEADIVILGISGLAALPPLLAAIGANKRIAIANKESLVCGGALVDAALRQNAEAELIPVDSEQSALFQCLMNGKNAEIQRLVLTASGGPFLFASAEQMAQAREADVLRHPTWRMGKKITIDSATLFNKGLEVIEAARLFHLAPEQIQVVIHPQSIVHSAVEFVDGTVMVNASNPDMRLPIQYALTYPDRLPSSCRPLSFADVAKLEFHPADLNRFGALRLAYDALKAGGSLPIVYNGANEKAVELFFAGRLRFCDIEPAVEYAMQKHAYVNPGSVEEILAADADSRALANEYCESYIDGKKANA